MSLTALSLILVAAVLHASWNLLVKRSAAKQIFTWWALVAGAALTLPLLLLFPIPAAAVWPLIIFSAIAEVAYYTILTYSYQLGDFSLVYPMARGSAPALLAVWADLFLGENFTTSGLIGLGLLLCGLVLVGAGGWLASRKQATSPPLPALIAALGVACCVSIYSAVDGAAMRETIAPPYLVIVMALTALLTTPAMLLRFPTSQLTSEWRANWRLIILTGALMMVVYLLVLYAYSLARVSYTGAVREVSVVFAALAGWLLLREGFGLLRVIGATLIFCGILVIALAG